MPPRCPRGCTSRRAARLRGENLEHHLKPEQHHRPGDVVAVGEERAIPGVGLLLGADPADRQDHLVGLTGEQVATAGTAVGEQADAGGQAMLDLGAIVGLGAGHHPPGLLLDPSKRGDVVVGAQQDPGLAGAGLGRQVGFPLDQLVRAVGQPASHVGRISVAHRPPQHRQPQPVDLEEDDARHRCLHPLPGTLRDPLRDAHRVGVVIVGADHDVDRHRHHRGQKRGYQRPAERVDLDRSRCDRGRGLQHQRIQARAPR